MNSKQYLAKIKQERDAALSSSEYWKGVAANKVAQYLVDGKDFEINDLKAKVIRLQAEAALTNERANVFMQDKANEDVRFNSVLQASIQTAIATAAGRRT